MSGRALAAAAGAAALAAVLVVGTLVSQWTQGLPPFGPGDNEWSAVILQNDNAYFGRLSNPPGQFLILREPYTMSVVPVTGSPGQSDVVVQRVTATAPGPTAEMRIDKGRVLIIEELRPDSSVVRAIAANRGR